MKNFYAILISSLFFTSSFAQNNTVVNNGTWDNNGTWSLGHIPNGGETVVIPSGYQVVVDNNIRMTSATLIIKVYGTLRFAVGKLDIAAASGVFVFPGGKITTQQGNASDRMVIGGATVYSGSMGTVSGPITMGTANPIILPVKFVAYNVTSVSGGVAIQWSTEEEKNADKYIIERSEDGVNWNPIGSVAATGNSSALNSYIYTDKKAVSKVAYYRVKQVDIDGHFVYTSIKAIKSTLDTATDIKIFSAANNLVVEFEKELKGSVVVRLVTLGGQVVTQKIYSQPTGYVIMNQPSLKGNYIVSISNGQDVKIAKQVIL